MGSKLLFQGNFTQKDITCSYNQVSSRQIDSVIEKKAKQIWQEKVKKAEKEGKKIWDQPVYRLEDFKVEEKTCHLSFATIPYSIRSSIKPFTKDLVKKGPEYLPMATYSLTFVETKDGYFVFGEKSDKYVANRKYSYIGGVYNKSKQGDASDSLFKAARKELEEELGIKNKEIKTFKLLGALKSSLCNVAFVFYCKLMLTKEGVLKRFQERNDLELKSLFFGKRKDLRDIGVNKIGKESGLIDIFEQNYQSSRV